jgi:hypothetical protein
MVRFHQARIRFRIVKTRDAALRKNFSIQESIFHIEKFKGQVVDFQENKNISCIRHKSFTKSSTRLRVQPSTLSHSLSHSIGATS